MQAREEAIPGVVMPKAATPVVKLVIVVKLNLPLPEVPLLVTLSKVGNVFVLPAGVLNGRLQVTRKEVTSNRATSNKATRREATNKGVSAAATNAFPSFSS
jgi:hypothetical protein